MFVMLVEICRGNVNLCVCVPQGPDHVEFTVGGLGWGARLEAVGV